VTTRGVQRPLTYRHGSNQVAIDVLLLRQNEVFWVMSGFFLKYKHGQREVARFHSPVKLHAALCLLHSCRDDNSCSLRKDYSLKRPDLSDLFTQRLPSGDQEHS
jgi:hypothetical protein